MKMMIDDFGNTVSATFENLLDIYQMNYWGMSFEEFKAQFIKEFVYISPEWTIEKEEVEER
jgi:hypothetical protein